MSEANYNKSEPGEEMQKEGDVMKSAKVTTPAYREEEEGSNGAGLNKDASYRS